MGSPWPFYNVATAVSDGFRAAGGRAATLEEVFAGASGYRVWLRDGMDDADRALRGAGFDVTDELPGLWMRLEDAVNVPPPEGYDLTRAESDEDIVACMLGDRWSGYMGDEEVAQTFPDPAAMARVGDRHFYLVRQQERLVATGQTIATGAAIAVFGMWTADHHRRRGVATALLSLALADARAAGNEVSGLQASEAGAAIYRRLGYRQYCHYRIYRPPGY
jgi:GNAT superfamily N-acetyltransferase